MTMRLSINAIINQLCAPLEVGHLSAPWLKVRAHSLESLMEGQNRVLNQFDEIPRDLALYP